MKASFLLGILLPFSSLADAKAESPSPRLLDYSFPISETMDEAYATLVYHSKHPLKRLFENLGVKFEDGATVTIDSENNVVRLHASSSTAIFVMQILAGHAEESFNVIVYGFEDPSGVDDLEGYPYAKPPSRQIKGEQGVTSGGEIGVVRLLISRFSEFKMDYVLTNLEFVEHGSRVDQFAEAKLTIPEITKKAEKHLNEVQIPQIAPAMAEGWAPEEGSGRLQFHSIELCEHGEFLYWKVHFLLFQPNLAGGPHSVFVPCYLDGTIARLAEHKPEADE